MDRFTLFPGRKLAQLSCDNDRPSKTVTLFGAFMPGARSLASLLALSLSLFSSLPASKPILLC